MALQLQLPPRRPCPLTVASKPSAARSTDSPAAGPLCGARSIPDYSWPQAQARMNRAMGVRRRSDAGERQLDEGLAFLQGELERVSAQHPDEAEHLQIPASVDAIAEKLGAVTSAR